MKTLWRAVTVLAVSTSLVVLGAGDAGSTKRASAPSVRKGLGAPGYLSPLARGLLKRRMARHGQDMLALTQAVIFLDHESTQRLATVIAEEPRLTRPIAGGEDDLNAALPERFFVLQDELRSRAKALAEVSRGTDNDSLAARFGELTQTCVSCHSTYLEPVAKPAP
jgi:hypothetical protein